MKKKIVVQVVGTMNRGGSETMLMELFRNLKDDFRFIFLVNKKKNTLPKGDYDKEIFQLGGEIIYIDAMWDVGLKNYISRFKESLIKIGEVDIVHSHLNSKGGIIAKAAKKCGIKRVIVHSHAHLKFKGPLFKVMADTSELIFQKHLINKYATDYWGCSQIALTSLFNKKNINSKCCHIINNAINVDKYTKIDSKKLDSLRSELNVPKGCLVIGTVGRIARVKQYEFIIDVLKELKNQKVEFKFIFVGLKQDKTYSELIFNKINENKLNNNILYLEPRSDLEYIYPLFDVFIGTSIREGLGMVAVEAQASGTQCLLSTGFPKQVDINLGLVNFIDTYNLIDWVNAIKHINMKPRIDKVIREKALLEKGFNIEEESLKVKRLYEKEVNLL